MTLLPRNEKNKIVFGMVLLIALLMLSMVIPTQLQRKFNYSYEIIYFISRMLIWLSLLAMLLYSLKVEKNRFLLWGEKPISLKFTAIAVFVLFCIMVLGTNLINVALKQLFHAQEDSKKIAQIAHLFKEHIWMLFFTTMTAGITEELLFRGYLQSRLQLFFTKPFWPIIISAAIFGLIHIGYGTIIQVIGPFFIGVVFASFYYKYRNLRFLIVFHFLWDLIGMYTIMKSI